MYGKVYHTLYICDLAGMTLEVMLGLTVNAKRVQPPTAAVWEPWARTARTELALRRRIGGEGRIEVAMVQGKQKRKRGTCFCSYMLNWEIYGE